LRTRRRRRKVKVAAGAVEKDTKADTAGEATTTP